MGMLGDIGLRGASRLGNRPIFNAARRADIGLARGAGWLGARQNAVNRYGGYALGAIGAASAAHIGSSVLASNRGF
jgi:hypothetical protein